MGRVYTGESAVEYFKELVDGALAHQKVSAGELTTYYVVQLLATRLRQAADDRDAREPLALRLVMALEGGASQRQTLRQIGDETLFVSGFFADSLARQLVDVDYYVRIGGAAYQALGRWEADRFSPVFEELALKFLSFVDVLSEVSERSACSSNADVLRLYDRWLRTRSARVGRLLETRGVIPNSSLKATIQ